MPRVPMSLLLHSLRANGRGRRFVARHRRHGVAGLRRFRRHMRDLRRIRRGGWNRQDLRRHHGNGAGPSHQHAPLHPEVPAWLLAGPAAPTPGVNGNVDPALAAPPPPFWCPEHGWVVCPLHQYGSTVVDAPLEPPTPVVVEVDPGAPLPRSPTVAHTPDAPLVQVRNDDALAFVSAPAGASVFVFGSGAGGSHNHATASHVAPLVPALEDWLLVGPAAPRMHVASVASLPPGNDGSGTEMAGAQADMSASLGFTAVDVNTTTTPLPSPTPATPPPSPRLGARRRLVALGLPLASPSTDSPTTRRGHRSGTWSPAALGLVNGACNGVAPGTSEDEDERGGSFTCRR